MVTGANQLTKNRQTRNLNETKNVPKNFGKAIIKFSEKREGLVRRCLGARQDCYQDFIAAIRLKKKCINSIAQLRGLWLEE